MSALLSEYLCFYFSQIRNRSQNCLLNHSWSSILTVQLNLTQSAKYPEAENFLRIATVEPNNKACPILIIPPAV